MGAVGTQWQPTSRIRPRRLHLLWTDTSGIWLHRLPNIRPKYVVVRSVRFAKHVIVPEIALWGMVQIIPKLIEEVVRQSIAQSTVQGQVSSHLNDVFHEVCLVIYWLAFDTLKRDIGDGFEVASVAGFEGF